MTGPPEAALDDALDALVAAGLVDETDDGVATTETFEATRRVYRDTYGAADDAVFRQTVAEAFGVSESVAADRIEGGTITREDLIAYLSLRSALPDVDDERLATMATLVAELSPGSPVPETVTELDDDDWSAFLDEHPDAVVTVWRHDCAPCEALKDDLDVVLSALPDGVAVAGVDGESVPDFRRTFGVDAAPAVCSFRGGDLEDVTTGRQPPESYADRFAAVYE
mgnify:CR=1 FL=1